MFALAPSIGTFTTQPNRLSSAEISSNGAHKYLAEIAQYCIPMLNNQSEFFPNSQTSHLPDPCSHFIISLFFWISLILITSQIIAHGLILGTGTYLKDGWNVLDGILVLCSWIDVIITYSSATAPEVLGALKVFRALRTLRPLRFATDAYWDNPK